MKSASIVSIAVATTLFGTTCLMAEEVKGMPFNVVQQKILNLEDQLKNTQTNIQQLSDNDVVLDKRLKATEKEMEELKLFKMKAEALLEALKYNDEKTHEQYLKAMEKMSAGTNSDGKLAAAVQANSSKLQTMNEDIDVLFEKMLDLKKIAKSGGGDSELAQANASKLQTMNEDIDVLFEKMLDLKKGAKGGGGDSELAQANAAKLQTMNEDIDVLFEKMLDIKKGAKGGGGDSELTQANAAKLQTMNEDIDVLFEKMLDLKGSINNLQKSSQEDIKAFEKKQPQETTNALSDNTEALNKLNEQLKQSLQVSTENQSNIKTLNEDIDVLFEKMLDIKKEVQSLSQK